MPGTQSTTFNAASTGKGAVLANVDSAGNITIWKIPAQSVIVVSPVPTSPAPSQLYSGSDEPSAVAAVDAQLKDF